MALYAISDLHLSFGTDKPMDIFGNKWENYEKRLEKNWNNTVKEDDTVILNGDISWAMYLEETYEDFKYIDSLNGNKIILKGNHDYWWTTMSKHNAWCQKNGFNSIRFLHNNCYIYNETAVCGTRGWQMTSCNSDDIKIYNREIERLKNSLADLKGKNFENTVIALHYPPDENFRNIISNAGVKTCIFGHLHGQGFKDYKDYTENGVEYKLVSSDYLKFKPIKILD